MEEGYARLREGGPVGVRGEAAVAWVEGPDAAGFLHGLLTQDVQAIRVGETAAALLLDAKGRIQSGMHVHRQADDGFTLVMDAALGPPTLEALEGFLFSEDLDLLGPESSAALTVAGVEPAAAGETADLVLPGAVPGTLELLVDEADVALAALGLAEAPPAALLAQRIEAGVPAIGVDTGPATLVQETGLEDVAVSFGKGCYLGQETVARVAHRGGVRRALRGLALGAPAGPGAEVFAGEAAAGAITTAAMSPRHGPIALAILRHEAEPESAVMVEGTAATVVELPFS